MTTRNALLRGIAVLAAVAAIAAAARCGDTATPVPVNEGPVVTSTAASTPSGVPDLTAGEELARGIDVPWGLAVLPDSSALIAERDTGRILQLPASGGDLRQVYQVPDIAAIGEGGLLGLAVSPDFTSDSLVYAYHTAAEGNRIVRFRLDGAGTPPQVVFSGIASATFHNGGRIAFGPDGMLYAGTGDAGRPADPKTRQAPTGRSCV